MDPTIGDLENADVLVAGTKIVAVGNGFRAPGARQIDASGMIAIPGFVDAHRHAWQAQLRRINPNAATLAEYAAATHHSFAKHYRPRDMYVGNLLSALNCIDAGITCLIDNSHNARSPAHSDMAIRGLLDSGIRAVHASGAPGAGEWDRQWPADLARLKAEFFGSENQLVTLAMFSPLVAEQWDFARKLGIRIHSELLSEQRGLVFDQLAKAGLVGPDNTLNHCGGLSTRTWEHIRKSGAAINVCPRSDSQYALDSGMPAYQSALANGLAPGFSIDNETSYGGDMFAEMHVALHSQRAVVAAQRAKGDLRTPGPVSVRNVLACATVNGAACAGLSASTGRIAPGMEADLVLIRTDTIDLYPAHNAVGTVVTAADRRSVDTVIVGGRIRKHRGTLIGVDIEALRAAIDESCRHLFSSAGYQTDRFAENFSLD